MRALINIRLPLKEDNRFIDIQEFREIIRLIGLRPADMPPDGPGSDDDIRAYCLIRADPIFDRMPENTDEQRAKKEFSRKNIVYASDLPESNTLFMVTAHTEGEYRFRLLNPKIEALQEGCKDLVSRIQAYNAKNSTRTLDIYGKIEILEHGLEESTISGTVVKNRWRTARKLAGRDILITLIGLFLFVVLFGAIASGLVSDPTLRLLFDRLSTAMFTATVVSAISVYYIWREVTPVIQWTSSYDAK